MTTVTPQTKQTVVLVSSAQQEEQILKWNAFQKESKLFPFQN